MEYTIAVKKDDGGWYIGQCVQLPEAMSQGETLAELMENMKDVIDLALECRYDEYRKKNDEKGLMYKKIIFADEKKRVAKTSKGKRVQTTS